MKKLDFEVISNQERLVENHTIENYIGFCDFVEEATDLYLKLMYEMEHKEGEPKTNQEIIRSYCWHHFFTIIYSFKACYNLCLFGYYTESTILLRHLFEVLIKMKFMQKHPETHEKYLERKPPESHAEMINEIAPNCYNDYNLLCGFSHGGMESWLMKIDHEMVEGRAQPALPFRQIPLLAVASPGNLRGKQASDTVQQVPLRPLPAVSISAWPSPPGWIGHLVSRFLPLQDCSQLDEATREEEGYRAGTLHGCYRSTHTSDVRRLERLLLGQVAHHLGPSGEHSRLDRATVVFQAGTHWLARYRTISHSAVPPGLRVWGSSFDGDQCDSKAHQGHVSLPARSRIDPHRGMCLPDRLCR